MEKVSSLKVSLVSILKAMANCNLEQDAKDLSELAHCAMVQVAKDSYRSVFEPDEKDSCKKDCFLLELSLGLKQALHTSDSNSCYSD